MPTVSVCRSLTDISVLCGLFLASAESVPRLWPAARPPAAGCPYSSSRKFKCCQCCHQFVCLLFEPWSCYYFGYGCSPTEKRGASQGACQVAAWPSVAFVLCPVSLVYPALPCPALAATTVNSRLGSACLVALFTFAAPAHWRHKQLYHGARGCKQVAAAHCATQHVVLATRRTQQTVAAAGRETGKRGLESFGIYRLVLDMRIVAAAATAAAGAAG